MLLAQTKILVSVKTAKDYLRIKESLPSEKYSVIPAYTIKDTVREALNGGFSIIVVDKKMNHSMLGDLIVFFNSINILQSIPVIEMEILDDGKCFFDNFGHPLRNGYSLEQLEENIIKLLPKNTVSFEKAENVANFIQSLVLALERRDSYSKNHSARVSKFARMIAENMGLDKSTVEVIEIAGLFHDIGKIGVPDRILLKPDKLDDEEFAVIKTHPVISEQICKPIMSFAPLLPIIRGHHERYDGKGYPDGKKGEEICLEARIVAVADAFDALTSNRAYRVAFSMEKVINILKDGSGTQWDSKVVDCFLENFDMEKIKAILRPRKFHKENLLSGTIFERANR